jgi:adenylate cyclase
MFLDMKSSTTLAERMGHERYFAMLNRYYADVTRAISSTSGEIWQYVGDEVVVTWTMADGLRDDDCVRCFFNIRRALDAASAGYTRDFGHTPGTKAGLHCGTVTTGEIGTVRKDIMFTGDVMNTTARIQSLCNAEGVDLLISDDLLQRLALGNGFRSTVIGERGLKGKEERVLLHTVSPVEA